MAGGEDRRMRRTTGSTAARDENGLSYNRLRDAAGPRCKTGMATGRGAAEARRPAPSSNIRGGQEPLTPEQRGMWEAVLNKSGAISF
jgi:hypothetical protein